MISLVPFVLAIIQVLPLGVEFDFAVFPANGTGFPYQLTVTIELDGGERVPVVMKLASVAEPQEVLDLLEGSLGDPKWDMTSSKTHLTIYGYGCRRVTKVEVASTGPAPARRWVVKNPPK